MKYTIISRDEFLKLIKFGTIYQSINYIVEEKNQQKVISEILKSLPYDDPFGYVVIEFTYEESFSIAQMQILVKLNIKDIINIYCLTNEALDFYKTKFNPNIKFKLFENHELIKEVDSYKLIEDKKKGIEVLFDIFKLKLKDVNEKFNTEYISKLLSYKENNYLNQEYKKFYFDLFCYERKNSFYKEDVGIIADIRAISKMRDIRKEKEVFLSGNYSGLSNEKDRESLKSTLKTLVIDSIDKVNKSDKKTDEEKKETIKNLVIGAIFLKSQKLLNTESKEENYWESFINFVNEFKEEFLEETKEALWYLGAFLGYKYLYDDYYKQLDLNIFKENSFSENNVNILKETNPLELELEKVRNENKELMGKVKELENANAEVCIHKETEQNLPNNASDVDNEQTKDYIPQVVELKKQEKETEPNNEISELEKKIESNQELPDIQNHNNETINKKYFQFTDEEITKFSLSHLQDIARERGVETPTSNKKFPNSPEGKIALYNAIKASQKLDI